MTKFELKQNVSLFIEHVKKSYDPAKPLVFWIDLFCGAGGTSTGIHFTDIENMFVAACVNHDANAILSHALNHPNTLHFTEDIRDFEVVKKLKYLVNILRKVFPNCKVNIWASLECTNFSKAKGGQARDADSRTLAEHMFMYLKELDPDYFWVENVREFMSWGPLSENGKPISRTEGKDYVKWIEEVKSYGFRYDAKLLNSANYGAYQSRERLFIQFANYGYPIQWPEQTHTKDKIVSPLFPMFKWKAVREVLDLDDEGESIFTRKKPLSDNTLKRIHAGLIKFVANGDDIFTKRYNGGKINPEQKVNSINRPMGTICTNGTHALVKTNFIKKYYSGRPAGKVIGVDGPAGSVTTVGGQAIVTASQFIQQRNSGDPNSKLVDINNPSRTITQTGGNQELVTASHLNTYYGNGGVHSIESPSPTITTKDRVAKIDVNFIDQQYTSSEPIGIDQPCNTLTTVPKFSIIKTKNFILNPSWGGNNGSVDNPCCTVVARQDKAPLYIVSTSLGELQIPIYDDDSETMICIKEFMASYGIYDIKMRMLNIPELKQIQGFPKDYKLVGNQTEQKKFIGNAVEVNQAKALVSCNYLSLHNYFQKIAV
ncbi:DNA cytosine methyltransferase [Flavobacterium sp.]|uniref:DNA cytosine methyltransferase n=1 Tax=Flavobacterium sp. TaxID=239 RepID=UPI0026390007|nr:DNA cytosine methyltransferase [Flavobacterium sp.]